MAEDSTFSRPWASFYTHWNMLAYVKWDINQSQDSSKADHKRPKSGQWPNLRNPCPFSKIVLPFTSLWIYPAHKLTSPYLGDLLTFWDKLHFVCGMCIPLSKSVLSLSEFFLWQDIKTWALSPEARWVISIKWQWVQSQVLVYTHKRQWGSSPRPQAQVSIWVLPGFEFHLSYTVPIHPMYLQILTVGDIYMCVCVCVCVCVWLIW